jgi:hypothetical protein
VERHVAGTAGVPLGARLVCTHRLGKTTDHASRAIQALLPGLKRRLCVASISKHVVKVLAERPSHLVDVVEHWLHLVKPGGGSKQVHHDRASISKPEGHLAGACNVDNVLSGKEKTAARWPNQPLGHLSKPGARIVERIDALLRKQRRACSSHVCGMIKQQIETRPGCNGEKSCSVSLGGARKNGEPVKQVPPEKKGLIGPPVLPLCGQSRRRTLQLSRNQMLKKRKEAGYAIRRIRNSGREARPLSKGSDLSEIAAGQSTDIKKDAGVWKDDASKEIVVIGCHLVRVVRDKAAELLPAAQRTLERIVNSTSEETG